MSFVIEQIMSISDDVFERLYADSKQKIEDGTAYFSYNANSDEIKSSIKNMLADHLFLPNGFALQVKKSNRIIFVASGFVYEKCWKCDLFLAGADSSGSRSYLYDTDWLIAMRDFHKSMESIYTEQEYRQAKNKSAESHYDQMIAVADSDARFTHTATKQDIDENISTRKLTGIN